LTAGVLIPQPIGLGIIGKVMAGNILQGYSQIVLGFFYGFLVGVVYHFQPALIFKDIHYSRGIKEKSYWVITKKKAGINFV
jgi:hypothetical protein